MSAHSGRGSRPADRRRGWVVILEGRQPRWGGEVQRSQVFRRLAERTEASIVEGFGPGDLRRAYGPVGYLPLPFAPRGRGSRPLLAASDPLRPDVLWAVRRKTDPAVLAYYDDPIAQTEALGIRLPRFRGMLLRAKRRANLDAFRWQVVPSPSFGDLAGLDPARLIVASNWTDARHIRPGPWPEQPSIGMVSGAAPGRGIEALVAAARLVRERLPDLRLVLWLVATGSRSAEYLHGLRTGLAAESWIEVRTAPYETLGEQLSQATVLVIPHPPSAYLDAALPVKLFDSMAAGRPLVVTPRTETMALVERHGAGVVARGDTVEDLADALSGPLGDLALARRLGAAARDAAERDYDWRVVGDRVATAVLEREGGSS